MQERHLYEYAVIRFVPKVEREEFINVGIVPVSYTHLDVYKRQLLFLPNTNLPGSHAQNRI